MGCKRIKPKDSILHPTPNSLTPPPHQNSLHQRTPLLLFDGRDF